MNKNEKNIDSKTSKQRKFKVNLKNNKDNGTVTDFYLKNLKKLHIAITIISIVLFLILFFYKINQYNSGILKISDTANLSSFSSLFQELFLFDLVVIIAGITPYFYISCIGIFQASTISDELFLRVARGASTVPSSLFGGLLQTIGFSLCVAIGLYYCYMTTKKRKYYNNKSFSFNDIKMQYYQIKKDDEKVAQLEKEKDEKTKKVEEYNVKIPYGNFVILGAIAIVIQTLGILISMI